MRVKRIGAYVGVDPTADSLHLGHLLPLMALFWLWFHGHPAVTLIGGATARIGDPTGRMKSRAIMTNGIISKNITKMHYQISKLWANVVELRTKYEYPDDWAAKRHLLNNSMWLQGLSMYDFTKAIARHTRVGPMLSRDTQVPHGPTKPLVPANAGTGSSRGWRVARAYPLANYSIPCFRAGTFGTCTRSWAFRCKLVAPTSSAT